MLQHFQGIEVKTKQPCFDKDMAILMDFRVDQSKGMHFIYLLPYSATEALVESTLFSTELVDEEFYSIQLALKATLRSTARWKNSRLPIKKRA